VPFVCIYVYTQIRHRGHLQPCVGFRFRILFKVTRRQSSWRAKALEVAKDLGQIHIHISCFIPGKGAETVLPPREGARNGKGLWENKSWQNVSEFIALVYLLYIYLLHIYLLHIYLVHIYLVHNVTVKVLHRLLLLGNSCRIER